MQIITFFSIPGLFILYLIKIEDFRDFILSDLYGIIPCTIPPIDTLIDVAFEYSIIANILLVTTDGRDYKILECVVFRLLPVLAVRAGCCCPGW